MLSEDREKEIRERNRKNARAYVKRHKEQLSKYYREWKDKNEEKRLAHQAVQTALRNKSLIKPDKCEKCLVLLVKLQAHHSDYSKPLKVDWLCSRCHRHQHGPIKIRTKKICRGAENKGSIVKLKEKDIPIIRHMILQGISYTKIGKKFGVSFSLISQIDKGRSWSHVQ